MPFTVHKSVKNASLVACWWWLVGVHTVELRLTVSRKHSLRVAFKMNSHNFRLEIRAMKLAWKFDVESQHHDGMHKA